MGSGGRHRSTDGGDAAQPVAAGSPRAAATLDERGRELLERLVQLALAGLPLMYRAESDIFAHTRAFQLHNRVLHGELRGTSPRYSAIVALGANWLPEASQPGVLGGHRLVDFVGLLVKRLDGIENLGDAALICWAAAQSGHSGLPRALARLRQLDQPGRPAYVVEAAWVVAALAAARRLADVEAPLSAARERLLGCAVPGSPVFPHITGP